MKQKLKLAVYGKGGVGKSVVATSLSVAHAQKKRSVLHIGCDPKSDSAVRLMADGRTVRTVLEVLGDETSVVTTDQLINQGRLGIHCCEAGGPRPGLGCGGRGVARTLEVLEEMETLEAGDYDVVIFDVLGDVVCGGFAAPLRRGFAEQVVIVTSEEPMAMYAANNISRAISTYHDNGVNLAGLVANLRAGDAAGDRQMLAAFAERLSTSVLATIPRDRMILESERKRRTVLEYAPEAESSRVLVDLAETLFERAGVRSELPTPMPDDEFYGFIEQW